jgi:hypothetical protein
MSAKIGTADVAFRLGAGDVLAVYAGSEEAWAAGLPGAPTITLASDTGVDIIAVFSRPETDGGAAISGYLFYVNGSSVTSNEIDYSLPDGVEVYLPGGVGDVLEVSAVNVVGEGPKSAPFTVTA